MKKIKLDVLGLSGKGQGLQQAYALVLSEADGPRRIPIVIGHAEAQAIAIALENMHSVRPLTHDLFVSFLEKSNASVKEVVIVKLESNIFYSEIIFSHNGNNFSLDARTSDAVTMAIKTNAPIYINEEILNRVGIDISKESSNLKKPTETKKKEEKTLEDKSLSELNNLLKKAIKAEDYELAAKIRDIIQQKKN